MNLQCSKLVAYCNKKPLTSGKKHREKLGIAATIIGIILFAIAILMKLAIGTAISYIGSADAPTTIFIAGKIGDGQVIPVIGLGIILFILGLYLIFRKKHK